MGDGRARRHDHHPDLLQHCLPRRRGSRHVGICARQGNAILQLARGHPPERHIPVNASILTSFLSGALAIIYIGSPLAFYAITSLYTVALLQCYCFSIGCLLWRRIYKPETLPPAAFSLGKWGIPINAFAVLFSVWCFFWSFWPQEYPITAAGFNWASPVFVAVLIGAAIFFVFQGKNQYFGPVTEVEGRKTSRK